MNREIERFINSSSSKIKSNQKLIIENNAEVIKTAIETDSFRKFIEQVEYRIEEMKNDENVSKLRIRTGLNL